MFRTLLAIALVIFATALVHVQTQTGGTQPPAPKEQSGGITGAGDVTADWRLLFPEDPVKQKIVDNCSACHDLRFVLSTRFDESHWEDTVWTMVSNGAKIELDDVPAIVKYLSTHFGPDKKPLALPVDINTAPIDQLMLIPALAPHAQAIVKAREASRFTAIDGLLGIEGITKDALEKTKPFLIVR